MKMRTIAFLIGAALTIETALGVAIPTSYVSADEIAIEIMPEEGYLIESNEAYIGDDIIYEGDDTSDRQDSNDSTEKSEDGAVSSEIVILDEENQIIIDDEGIADTACDNDEDSDATDDQEAEEDVWNEPDDIVLDEVYEDDEITVEEWNDMATFDTDEDAEEEEEDTSDAWEDGTVVGFGDYNPDEHSVEVTKGRKPSVYELTSRFPSQISLEIEKNGKKRYQNVDVTWYCVGDDFEESEGYYFQFSPKWNEDAYKLQGGLNVETDGPYVPVYVVVDKSGRNTRVQGMDGIKLSDEEIAANKQAVYDYLVGTMDLNSAAACGVMANIQYESGFNNTIYGDGGTSYGLCQWHNSRFTSLRSYCSGNGYDYSSVDGQLHYLEHELNNSYTGVLNYLREVSNDEEGAYNAAYYWCVHFEVPADRYTKARTRGNLAKSTYWPKYGNTKPQKKKEPVVYNIRYVITNGLNNPDNPSTYTEETDTITLLDPIIATGYKFEGWKRYDNGTLKPIKTIEKGTTGDLTLFAQIDKISYKIKFYGNGAKSGSMTVMKNCRYDYVYKLNKNKYKRPGYTFKNWNTKKDGTGKAYKDKEKIKNLTDKDGTVKLFAQWKPIKYSVKYDKNGGTGKTMKKTSKVKYDKKFTLKKNTYTKKGYTFAGWNTKKDGSGTMYVDQQEVSELSKKEGATVTLYAQWTLKDPEIVEE